MTNQYAHEDTSSRKIITVFNFFSIFSIEFRLLGLHLGRHLDISTKTFQTNLFALTFRTNKATQTRREAHAYILDSMKTRWMNNIAFLRASSPAMYYRKPNFAIHWSETVSRLIRQVFLSKSDWLTESSNILSRTLIEQWYVNQALICYASSMVPPSCCNEIRDFKLRRRKRKTEFRKI